LAAELGTAREVVSPQLNEFQRRGWISTSRGAIDISRPDALREDFYFAFMRAEENSHRNFMPRGLAASPVHRLEDMPCWTSFISRSGLASSP
jgi:hypothetical protein